ncbi:hypothetical protein RJT34_32056 [Clitoria ternatea]|uniref:Glycine-rich protein n=1 Tax=Clitoria ternatea TaxID=43366 RepID=A0AAN9EVP6_CLITE
MQGRGGGRDPFFDFGDPFAGFGGFGSFGVGPPRNLISSFFGGRDPFDDPFFTRPFGGMFESSPFGGPAGFPFPAGMHPSGFLEHQAPEPSRPRGPIIQELDSDDDKEDNTEKKGNPRKHSRSSNEPFVEHPEDELEGKKSRHLQGRNEYNGFNVAGSRPQSQSFCFQSSTVSYGGPNGAYYTSSRTRRTGSDGVTFEESKEADSSTREASHLIARGIQGKGHSLSRKLNSDGKVDTMQTLHNINEDELADFEEEWKGKGPKYLPGWTGSIGAGQAEQAGQGGWALPSSEYSHPAGARDEVGSSRARDKVRTDSKGRSAYHPGGRGRN